MSFALANVLNVTDNTNLGVAETQSVDELTNTWMQHTSSSSPVQYAAAPIGQHCSPNREIYQHLKAQFSGCPNLGFPHLFQLTDIKEDASAELLTLDYPSKNAVGDADSSMHLSEVTTYACAAPAGMCFILQGRSISEESGSQQSDTWVTCTNSGCNYGGPLHQNCLQRWVSFCELRCRMLASSTTSTAASHLNGSDASTMLEMLFALYRCPRCGKCSLQRIKNCDIASKMFVDPIPSVLDAVQFVSEQLSPADGAIHNHSANHADIIVQQTDLSPQPDVFEFDTWLPLLAPKEVTPSTKPHPITRASWHTADVHSIPATPSLTRETQLLRRLSLHRGTSTGSVSSGSTSGFASGTNGSSSGDNSRRSSQNAHKPDSSEDSNRSSGSRAITWAALAAKTRTKSVSDNKGDSFSAIDSLSSLGSDPSSLGTSVQQDTASNEASTHWQFRQSLAPQLEPLHAAVSGGGGDGGGGRRKHHNSTSAARVSSFWPSDSMANSKSTNSNESDKRKTVNRKGNIFQPRPDFNVFETLPAHKRNAYFIQMDDDSCTGNEDTRAFLLTQLTSHRLSEVRCLACQKPLTVYDHFPVVDGIFFISPICHDSDKTTGLRITWHTNSIAPALHATESPCANVDPDRLIGDDWGGRRLFTANKPVVPPPGCLGPRQQLNVAHLTEQGSSVVPHPRNSGHSSRQERYLHALCMSCLEDPCSSNPSAYIYCRVCGRPWSGTTLLVGGLYTYDIFAASPCCPAHLTCNKCGKRLDHAFCSDQETTSSCIPPNGRADAPKRDSDGSILSPLPFFSQYSQLITCPFCAKVDYHFAKPLRQMYHVVVSSSSSV